jgi:hypothetical protein
VHGKPVMGMLLDAVRRFARLIRRIDMNDDYSSDK